MRLKIENKLDFFNDHYFTSLCLLYFPHEDFASSTENYAEFFLRYEGEDICCDVTLMHGEDIARSFVNEKELRFPIELDEYAKTEIVLGHAFLRCGKELFGFLPCWGHPSGLRPVIRARHFLSRFDESDVVEFFKESYLFSEEKARLCVDVAVNATENTKILSQNDCFLYLSIPFCPTRCSYCSFVALESKKLKKLLPDYLLALEKEMAEKSLLMKANGHRLRGIYIGGGTPSILDEVEQEWLHRTIERIFPLDDIIEYTFEAGRPDTITEKKLSIAKAHGVNRISVNPQSTNDEVLKAIGRDHGAELFYEAARLSEKFGFTSRNADIIVGLPEDDDERFDKTVADVLSFGFENITIHSLTVKNASLLSRDPSAYDPCGSDVLKRLSRSHSVLKGNGYLPYYLYRQKKTVGGGENCGFSLPSKACIYNIASTDETHSIYGCGSGATTKLIGKEKVIRSSAPRYPYEYLKKFEK